MVFGFSLVSEGTCVVRVIGVEKPSSNANLAERISNHY